MQCVLPVRRLVQHQSIRRTKAFIPSACRAFQTPRRYSTEDNPIKFTAIGRFKFDRDPLAPLEPGEFFLHRSLGYRAVILRVDKGFHRDNPVHSESDFSPEDRGQHFYLALPDERDSNKIESYDVKASPVQYGVMNTHDNILSNGKTPETNIV